MGECKVLPHLFWDMTMAELDCDTRNFVKPRIMTKEELEQTLKKYGNI